MVDCLVFIYFLNLFIYFWLCWVFIAVRGLSLVAVSRGYSSLWCAGFSLRWLLLLQSTGSRRMGFSSCSTWAQQLWLTGSRVQAQQLWRTGLVALQHVGSSQTRAQTHVPCIGRRILNHHATREALVDCLLSWLLVASPSYEGSLWMFQTQRTSGKLEAQEPYSKADLSSEEGRHTRYTDVNLECKNTFFF